MDQPPAAATQCPVCQKNYETIGRIPYAVVSCRHTLCVYCVPVNGPKCKKPGCNQPDPFDPRTDFDLIKLPARREGARGPQNHQPPRQFSDAEKTEKSIEIAVDLRFDDILNLFNEMRQAIRDAEACFIVINQQFPFEKKFHPNCAPVKMERMAFDAQTSFNDAVKAAKEGIKAVYTMAHKISASSLKMVQIDDVVAYTVEEKQCIDILKVRMGQRELYEKKLQERQDLTRLRTQYDNALGTVNFPKARDVYLKNIADFFRSL